MIRFLEIGIYMDKLKDKLLGWYEELILRLPNLILAIFTLFLFYFIAKGVASLVSKILRARMDNISVRHIIKKLIFLVILLIGFFISLNVLGLDKALATILAGAGVIALAFGLALQGTLNNTFSGVLLSFLPRIRIHDYIETENHKGFVEEISLRNFVLRQPDNHIVVMPNSLIVDKPFVNFSLTERSRITVKCGVAYSSNLREVRDMIMKLMTDNFPQEAGEKIEFYWLEFGDSSINFMTRFSCVYQRPGQMFDRQSEAIMLIKEEFDRNNINIPFPIRTLHMGTNVEIAKEREPKNEE
ncbi:mechanosensitive ion channel [Subsaximicrobium wynnwilliamsii]|uniref:Mechanosensitive ion channel n=1 Tax=Subsaximicrobium wynnwilliamsii TaxID=291179 RepID=A0A5C6ZIV4_9FLAO|nr:mechanosensitive ion channel family protein [Subsaximicrobium wynnwilliamsii]TXD84110.1 mechanosensitive ion channel [Subsaximicrobium wynnwilliamsii]TXD88932.1 mechanosensitive ion channel [Subsaximicrobium wynnwilliamsii]TXE03822.1 mechanosensitive ion channel [Subsaximicrobium wynnwilliamsii]